MKLIPPLRIRLLDALQPLLDLSDDADGGDFANAGWRVREAVNVLLKGKSRCK